jgi:hypothetical protein
MQELLGVVVADKNPCSVLQNHLVDLSDIQLVQIRQPAVDYHMLPHS